MLVPAQLAAFRRLAGHYSHFLLLMVPKILVVLMILVAMLKRGEINTRHQLVFNMVYGIVEGIHKFIKILFVQEYFVLLVGKAFVVLVEPLFALRNGYIKVVCPGRFHVKKISALARLHFLGENFVPAIVFDLFHCSLGLVGCVFRSFEGTI